MSDERKKVSPEQLSMLIMEVEKDPLLLTGRGRQKGDKAEHFEKWEQLAKKLNAIDNGAVKVVSKWQQVMRDWKSNTKKKVIKAAVEGSNAELSDLESRVLHLYKTESSDNKSPGIDISNIAEIDPLSSEEDNSEHDFDTKPFSPDMFTIYTQNLKTEDRKRCSNNEGEVAIQRKRVRLFSNENTSHQTEQLSRLLTKDSSKTQIKTTLSEALNEFRKQNEARERDDPVEVIRNAMETYTVAIERQASTIQRQVESMEMLSNAMNRMAEILDRRVVGG
ncbi:uncharacterized protein LOC113237561 isoform X2 [Hyposmocoma kahamanoa]|uniref:uncharacterized protein LOC113237561 isoform X2 n=1 Tax=Hyposmocoma kahamanoa TaxID=1477025 RepID=UPI000E6D8316|nr:uncharacterized protein LOC113237561 isoform X2 [Hyposmocoma kahamanoa]